jgi:hypothetical protein
MAAVNLTYASLTTLKNCLRSEFPRLKSSHLSESLARALGYRTNAALLADMTGPEEDRPFVLLDRRRFLDRLYELGYPDSEDFDFELLDISSLPGVISTEPPSAYDIEYKTQREKAWRNLMVCAINAGLAKKLFTLRPDGNNFGDGRLFDFTLPDGTPACGWVRGISYSELSIHAAANPTGRFLSSRNAGFNAGDAFGTTWLERKRGAWMQTSPDSFRCRKPTLKRLSSIEVEPAGYGDRGGVIN